MKPVANHPHEGKTRTRVGPASLLLLLLAALAPALVEASLPRAGASLLEHEEVAASRLDSSRQAAPFRSPAIAPVAPATIGNGFTLFAGDELARASRAPGAPALAPDHAGDLALASREREERFALHQGADAFGLEPLRGPPPLSEDLCQGDDECLAGTRIGGLELSGPFFTEGQPRLSLELQWACSVSRCGLADGKPLDPWGLTSFREWVNEFADDAFAGDSVLKKVAAGGLFLADAAFSVASAGATDKIHGAQEALDRGQISDGEYWKRTGVAVGQTVASYAAGGAAGRAGAQAARGLTSRIAQGAMAGAAGGLGGQAGADAVGVAFGTQEAPSSWQSYAASAGFGAAFGAAAGLKSATTKEVGEYGEKYAADFLERRGYSDVEGVQNASGHGIDLAPTNPQGARRFVEVKTSRGPEAGRLRGAQAKGADAFATSRLQRAAGGARGWQNVDPGVTARARSLRTEVLTSGEARGFVMEITKAGSWNQKLAVRPW